MCSHGDSKLSQPDSEVERLVEEVLCYVRSTDVESCEKADWHSLTLLKLGTKAILNISPPSPWFSRLTFDSSEGKAVSLSVTRLPRLVSDLRDTSVTQL